MDVALLMSIVGGHVASQLLRPKAIFWLLMNSVSDFTRKDISLKRFSTLLLSECLLRLVGCNELAHQGLFPYCDYKVEIPSRCQDYASKPKPHNVDEDKRRQDDWNNLLGRGLVIITLYPLMNFRMVTLQ